MWPEWAPGVLGRSPACGRPATAAAPAARPATWAGAGPASTAPVTPDAKAAKAVTELAITRAKREGLRIRVLTEDKDYLRSGARRALGFRPLTPACRQRRGARAAA